MLFHPFTYIMQYLSCLIEAHVYTINLKIFVYKFLVEKIRVYDNLICIQLVTTCVEYISSFNFCCLRGVRKFFTTKSMWIYGINCSLSSSDYDSQFFYFCISSASMNVIKVCIYYVGWNPKRHQTKKLDVSERQQSQSAIGTFLAQVMPRVRFDWMYCKTVIFKSKWGWRFALWVFIWTPIGQNANLILTIMCCILGNF